MFTGARSATRWMKGSHTSLSMRLTNTEPLASDSWPRSLPGRWGSSTRSASRFWSVKFRRRRLRAVLPAVGVVGLIVGCA